jgi:Flp pilus assembly protein CpaB
MRLRARRGGRSPALLAVGVAGLAGALALLVARDGVPAGPGVLVAARDLPAGVLFDEETLGGAVTAVPVPGAGSLRGVVTSPSQALGRRLAGALAAGEPLTSAALGGPDGVPLPLAPGERAVPVPASAAGGASAALAPGVRVDVVASTGEGFAGRAEVVVAGAEVLAVDRTDTGVDGGAGTVPSVLLRATAGQALRITSALNFARDVRLLVRPEGEAAPAPGGRP